VANIFFKIKKSIQWLFTRSVIWKIQRNPQRSMYINSSCRLSINKEAQHLDFCGLSRFLGLFEAKNQSWAKEILLSVW